MTAGCKAQTTPPQAAMDSATINRRVEIMVRSEFNIPQDYIVTLGVRKPSQIPGYDSLPITIMPSSSIDAWSPGTAHRTPSASVRKVDAVLTSSLW